MSNSTGKGIHCLDCHDVIYSEYTHDFKRCKCKKVFVDGGREYLRIGFHGRKPEVVERGFVPQLAEGLVLETS